MLIMPSLAIICQTVWIAYTIKTFNLYSIICCTWAITIGGYALVSISELIYDLRIKQHIKKEAKQEYKKWFFPKVVDFVHFFKLK